MNKENEIEQLKEELESIKRRLASALQQRDEWALRYAKAMEEKKS